MVRNYKPKKDTKLLEANILQAVYKIENENSSIRAAAKAVEIPFSTLHSHLMQIKKPSAVRHVGTIRYIPEEHENELAACLKSMARWGFPLTRKEIKITVSDFVATNKEGTSELAVHLQNHCRFKDNMPGEDWISSFLHRHNLSVKKPSILERSRIVATCNPFIIYEFYDLLEKEMSLLNLEDKPSNIYNLDETAMFLDPSKTKAIGEKGKKLVRATATSGREAVTVLACVNAAGERHPPLIVFSGKKLQSTWRSSSVNKNLTLAVSETGWMSTEIFESWFMIFCQQVKSRPLLLIYDGHKTHMSMTVIAKARSEQISIIKLPAHTTDILQPLDKCCFRPLKMKWDKRLTDVQRLTGATRISKSCFTELVDEILPDTLTSANIKSGFSSTGIFPVDRTKYPTSRFCSQMLSSYTLQNSPSKSLPQVTTDIQPNLFGFSLDNTIDDLQDIPSSSTSTALSPSQSFEELLSMRLRRTPKIASSETRRKIETNAAVITSNEFLELVEKRDQETKRKRENPKLKTNEKKKQKVEQISNKEDTEAVPKVLQVDQINKNTQLDYAKVLLDAMHRNLSLHSYYAVYYDNDPIYIGKALKKEGDSVEMKFLEKGAGNYKWPKRDKIESVNVKYIFYGPVTLNGANPFTVDDAAINSAYKCYKKFCIDFWKI